MRSIFAVAAGLLAAVAAFAADPLPRAAPESVGMSSARLARIAPVLNDEIQKGRMPGAVLAIARRGKLVYYQAFGYLDKDAGTKMTADAIFSIASMTKPMVAAGALTLYEQGRLQVDDPVSAYLPQFGRQQVAVLRSNDGGAGFDLVAAARQPTIMDLPRHTSGIIYGGAGTPPLRNLHPPPSSPPGPQMSRQRFLRKDP